jgi:hypothetical protein
VIRRALLVPTRVDLGPLREALLVHGCYTLIPKGLIQVTHMIHHDINRGLEDKIRLRETVVRI